MFLMGFGSFWAQNDSTIQALEIANAHLKKEMGNNLYKNLLGPPVITKIDTTNDSSNKSYKFIISYSIKNHISLPEVQILIDDHLTPYWVDGHSNFKAYKCKNGNLIDAKTLNKIVSENGGDKNNLSLWFGTDRKRHGGFYKRKISGKNGFNGVYVSFETDDPSHKRGYYIHYINLHSGQHYSKSRQRMRIGF